MGKSTDKGASVNTPKDADPKSPGAMVNATGEAAQTAAENDAEVFPHEAMKTAVLALVKADLDGAQVTFYQTVAAISTIIAPNGAEADGTYGSWFAWEEAERVFGKTYAENCGVFPVGHVRAGQRRANDESIARRWREVVAELKNGYGMKKPGKPTEAATDKAKQRAEAKAKADSFLESQKVELPVIPAKPADIDPKAMRAAAKAARAALALKAADTLTKTERTSLTERAAAFDAAADRGVEARAKAERAGFIARATEAFKRLPLPVCRQLDAAIAKAVEENEPKPEEQPKPPTADGAGDGADKSAEPLQQTGT